MKGLRYGLQILLVVVALAGCRKTVEVERVADPVLEAALVYVKAQMAAGEFGMLDVDHAKVLRDREGKIPFVQLPVKGSSTRSLTVVKTPEGFTANWLDLKTQNRNSADEVLHIQKINSSDFVDLEISGKKVVKVSRRLQAEMQVSLVKYEDGVARMIREGSELSKHEEPDPEGDPAQWLPEFTLTVTLGNTPRELYSLYWLTNMNSAYLYSYTLLDLLRMSGGSGGAPDPAASVPLPEDGSLILEIPQYEFETGPTVDLEKLLKCFDGIPNAGAKFSVTLYADLPVNSDVTQLTKDSRPGHSFIGMTKQNGGSSITQIFGFYPSIGMLSVFGAAVKSKIRDDSNHEFDASLTLDVDEYSFSAVGNLGAYYSNALQYDINDFNCTNFAIDLFNMAISLDDKIIVDNWRATMFDLNFGTTPNGLYQYLTSIPSTGSRGNVSVGTKSAERGNGECK